MTINERAALTGLCLIAIFSFNSGAIEAQSPTLINSYNFSSDLTDSLATGDALIEDNTASSSFGGGMWSWTASSNPGGGLILDTVNTITDHYSVSVRFMYSEVGPSWKKIISFKDQSDDNGFYLIGGRLQFYPYGTLGTTVFPANTMLELVVTRDNTTGTITAFVVESGTLTEELQVADPLNSTIPQTVSGKSRFRFFQDDTATNIEWTSSGSADWIRVWDGPLSAAEVPVELSKFSIE